MNKPETPAIFVTRHRQNGDKQNKKHNTKNRKLNIVKSGFSIVGARGKNMLKLL